MDEKMFRFILNEVLDAKFKENNERLKEELEEKLNKNLEAKFEHYRQKIDEKLDAKFEHYRQELDEKLDKKLDAKFEHYRQELDEKLDSKLKENNEKLQAKILNIMNLNNEDIFFRVDQIIAERVKNELAPINSLLVSHDFRIKQLENKY